MNNTQDEYIELQNISEMPVLLFDQNFPTNRWQLRNAVDFDFPASVTLLPGAYLMVVAFNPAADANATAAWRTRNGVPETVPLYGPWTGVLDNAGETIELKKPDVPDTNGVPFVLVERIKYDNQSPWPVAADAMGMSLQRVIVGDFGNDVTN